MINTNLNLNQPRYLYKYLGESLVGFFENCGVRFTPRSSFNDPFEQLKSDRDQLDQLDADQRNALFANCANTFAHSQKLVTDILNKKVTFNASPESTDKPDYTNGAGLLCLSEIPDSLLMWSHYACDHRGVVLEIDFNYFHQRQLYQKTGEFIIRKVIYRDSRVDDQPNGLGDYLFETPHQTISTKSSHWSYEHEWRIEAPFNTDLFFILKDENGKIKLDKNKNPYLLHKIPEKYITKVIFSTNCHTKDIIKIKNQIVNNPNLSHIAMKLAVLDPVDFRLRLINLKGSDFTSIDEQMYAA